jgi:hypothetical protein
MKSRIIATNKLGLPEAGNGCPSTPDPLFLEIGAVLVKQLIANDVCFGFARYKTLNVRAY